MNEFYFANEGIDRDMSYSEEDRVWAAVQWAGPRMMHSAYGRVEYGGAVQWAGSNNVGRSAVARVVRGPQCSGDCRVWAAVQWAG